MSEFKVSPSRYLRTCRLLLAKNLLTDTRLSVTDIAMTAGFGSLRRFNALFKQQYRMPPTVLRKQTAAKKESLGDATLTLGYRPPYQWENLLDFLKQRAIPGVEVVSDDVYMRAVQCATADNKVVRGWFRVAHRSRKNALTLTVSSGLSPVLPRLLARVRNLFDLDCRPDVVYETLSIMNEIRPGLCAPGVRLPGCFEPFEMAVRAVLGQQITVKAASVLAGRIAEAFGTPVETGIEGLTHAFPSARDLLSLEGDISDRLGPLGVTRVRAGVILSLAQKMLDEGTDFTRCLQPEASIQQLMTISGIGAWTAQYLAMRVMGWPDAFPHTDFGVKKALAPLSCDEILETGDAWRPWRAYATINLWNSLKT